MKMNYLKIGLTSGALVLLSFYSNCSQVSFDGTSSEVQSLAASGIKWVLVPGTCSAQCGPGTQIPSAVCEDDIGNIIADSFCTDAKPSVSASACNIQPCANQYKWLATPQGSCIPTAGTCGTGTQPQIIVCTDAASNIVSDLLCDSATRPANIVACSTPCTSPSPSPNPSPSPSPSPSPGPGPSPSPGPSPAPAPAPAPAPSPAPAPQPSGAGCNPGTYYRCIVNAGGSTSVNPGSCENGYSGNCIAECHTVFAPSSGITQPHWYIISNCGQNNYFSGLVP